MNLEKEVFEISLNDLIPNRFQPREIFSDEELKDLADSIKEHGVIQPIIVRKVGDKYEIIAGERRFRASRIAGKQTVPALVRDIDDREAAKIALLENLQRSNLTPIEEAKTYQTILKIDNITQDQLAVSLGKNQSTIANKLRLLTLNEDVQTALLNSQISERHARSLLNVNSKEQSELLKRIISEKLTVRQLDEEITKLTGKSPQVDEDIEEKPQSQVMPVNVPAPKTQPQTNVLNNEITKQNNNIEKTQTEEEPLVEEHQQITEQDRPINIFDKLRIPNPELTTNETAATQYQSEIPSISEQPNVVYDLRFAINNFRQAVQNTEKFGFKVNMVENNYPTKYQIIVEIDKN